MCPKSISTLYTLIVMWYLQMAHTCVVGILHWRGSLDFRREGLNDTYSIMHVSSCSNTKSLYYIWRLELVEINPNFGGWSPTKMPQLAISVKSPGQQKALRRKALWFFLLGYSERYSIWYLVLFSPRMLGYNLYIADISITGTALQSGFCSFLCGLHVGV